MKVELKKSMQSDIVIGLQYGDEGKGKVVASLINNESYTCCVRYNGGPNAGHTIYIDNPADTDQKIKIVTHQIPSGAVKGIRSLIGSSCMIDALKLEAELTMLENAGITNVRDILKISYNACMIDASHIEQDKNEDTVGSTGCGMGPAYMDKYARCARRVDNTGEDRLCGCEIVDPVEFFQPGDTILFEGAQGFMLDINWGKYPYVTSTHCDTGFIVSTGVSPRTIRDVYGIIKAYTTYVGNMEFQPKNEPVFNTLAELGHEVGSTTGRPRQCDWLNMNEVNKAIRVCGVNIVIVNKCDIVQQLGIFKLYHNDKLLEFKSWALMQNYIQVELETLVDQVIFSYSPNKI